jgi:hypothetical protein
VTFSGAWISLAWAILGLAFAALGARFDRDLARGAGIGTWALAVGDLLLDSATARLGEGTQATWLTVLNQPIRACTVLGWLLAGAGQAISWLTQAYLPPRHRAPPAHWESCALLTGIVASLVWVTASVQGLPPLGATFALVVGAWLLVAADRLSGQPGLIHQALAIFTFAAVKWVVIDTLAERLSPEWNALEYVPVFNPMMGVGLLVAASLGALFWLRQRTLEEQVRRLGGVRLQTEAVTFAMIALVGILATLGLSFEVDRLVERAVAQGVELVWPALQLKSLGLTLLWTVGVVALAWTCRSLAPARPILWFLLALLAMKFLTVDTLFWRLSMPVALARVFLNIQVITAAILLLGMSVLYALVPFEVTTRGASLRSAGLLLGLAVLILNWSGMLEIERAVEHLTQIGYEWAWPDWQLKQLLWTMWWVAVVLGSVGGLRWGLKPGPLQDAAFFLAWGAAVVIACKYLTVDTLFPRLEQEPVGVMVLFNLQALTAVVVFGGLIGVQVLAPLDGRGPQAVRESHLAVNLLALLIVLWVGTLEIDRAFASDLALRLSDPRLAMQVAVSIYWSLFALASVAAGFRFRTAWLRYFGLSCFAATLLKVLVIDLSQVGHGYRILSTIGLGLLLLGTSVLYGKLSPVLLGGQMVSGEERELRTGR